MGLGYTEMYKEGSMRILRVFAPVALVSLIVASVSLEAQQSQQVVKWNDGKTQTITSPLPVADTLAAIKGYFDRLEAGFETPPGPDFIYTVWDNDHRCGIGFNRCQDRSRVQVVTEGTTTTVKVRVYQRKREGGLSPKPWPEDNETKVDDKLTTKLVGDLKTALAAAAGGGK